MVKNKTWIRNMTQSQKMSMLYMLIWLRKKQTSIKLNWGAVTEVAKDFWVVRFKYFNH